jgi:hypothetical protein
MPEKEKEKSIFTSCERVAYASSVVETLTGFWQL